MISGLSILIERKSRRSELALYALPRAADSVFLILNDRKLAFSFPKGELLLFCASMSAVMFFYDNHKETVSPLVEKLLTRFLSTEKLIKLSDGETSERGVEEGIRVDRNLKLADSKNFSSSLSLSGSLITP